MRCIPMRSASNSFRREKGNSSPITDAAETKPLRSAPITDMRKSFKKLKNMLCETCKGGERNRLYSVVEEQR
eukprot:1185502-Prorocentrum_minimum.AAC.4